VKFENARVCSRYTQNGKTGGIGPETFLNVTLKSVNLGTFGSAEDNPEPLFLIVLLMRNVAVILGFLSTDV